MKTNLLIITLLMAQLTWAANSKVITHEQFQQLIKKDLDTADINDRGGELEDFGVGCEIQQSVNAKGTLMYSIVTENGMKLTAMLLSNTKPTLKVETEEEADYYQHTYEVSFGNKITFIYVADSSDSVRIENSTTKLTCYVNM